MEHLEFIQPPPRHQQPDGARPWLTAPLSIRVVAATLDTLLALLAGGLFTIVAALALGTPDNADGAAIQGPMALGMPVGALVYLGLSEARRGQRNGQTLGKWLLSIRTVRNDGAPLPRTKAWQRATLLALPMSGIGLPAAWSAQQAGLTGLAAGLAGELPKLVAVLLLAAALTNTYRRSLHDRVIGTTVVFSQRLDEDGHTTPHDGSPIVERSGPQSRTFSFAMLALISLAALTPSPF